MRLLRICSAGLYAAQYDKCITNNVSVDASYEEALGVLRSYGMLYPSSFSHEMIKQGIDAQDIIPDLPYMQNLWKKQHGSDQNDILFQQIQHYKPDVLYFQELDVIPHAVRKSLKKKFSCIKIIAGFKGFPPRMFSDYADLDHVFISYPYFRKQWEEVGVSVTILPHCFDPGSRFLLQEKTEKIYDFTFLGSTGFGNQSQEGRYYALKTLMNTTPLEVWGREQHKNIPYYALKGVAVEMLSKLPASVVQSFRKHLFSQPRLDILFRDALLVQEKKLAAFDWYLFKKPLQQIYPHRFHPPVSGNEYVSVIAASRVCLNRHTDEVWEGGNIRTFEVAGAGSCLLTDDRPNIGELFSDSEIVRYTSLPDCAEKTEYLLAHDYEREAIAARGRARVLRDHTTYNRCQKIKDVFDTMVF